jgi:hypothetical protein
MRNQSKGNDVTAGGSDWVVRYGEADRVECQLHRREVNGDVDRYVAAIGFGETKSEALTAAIADLHANLAAGKA